MYSGRLEDGSEFTFGTSGLLYRSNKLMYDRQTFTLWGNLTGEPVVGKMAMSGQKLRMLPVTLTTWSDWRSKHPGTKVLYLEDDYGRKWNYRYRPGLADRARAGVRFPVWQKSKTFKEKDEVYGIQINGHAKAYLMKALQTERVINDHIGENPIVLVVDSKTEAVRVYQRKNYKFTSDLKDEQGRTWSLLEEALVLEAERLPRVPGFVTFWFAWFGFFPHTETYGAHP